VMNKIILILIVLSGFCFAQPVLTTNKNVYERDLAKLLGYSPIIDSLIIHIENYAPGGAADTSRYHLISMIIFLQDSLNGKLNRSEYSPSGFDTTFVYQAIALKDDSVHYHLFNRIIGLQDTVNKFVAYVDSNGTFGWYRRAYVNAALAGKAATVHTHTESQITDLVHFDVTAFHSDQVEEFNNLTYKTPADKFDVLVIEDSAEGYTKKKTLLEDLPLSNAVQSGLDSKQATLVSGTNIKTVNSTSLLGSGDIAITAFTDELAQDAIGTMADANTLTYTDGTPLLEVKNQMSITDDANGIKLSGDATSPGNSMLYGTNGSGTKGWYAQPGGAAPTGVVDEIQISILQGDGNLSEASGVQTWAGSDRTTQDVFTVTANTTYIVEGSYYINTGTTTHTTAMAWSTGATITDFQYKVILWSAAANTLTTTQSTVHVSGVASKVLNATATTVYTIIQFKGTIVVGGTGGTITPQINFSANPTGTCLMKRGSWISFSKFGTDTDILKGGWN